MGFVKRDAPRWRNGVIPLERKDFFDPSSELARPDAINALNVAIRELREKTAIHVVEWSGEGQRVVIEKGIYGPMSVDFGLWFIPRPAYGRDGDLDGVQYIHIPGVGPRDQNDRPTQYQVYMLIHELCHVIGLFHEHTRPDRDEFVNVTAFDPFNHSKFLANRDLPIGPYDCKSIMNYYNYDKIQPTSRCGSNFGYTISSQSRLPTLSNGDVRAINFLYPIRRHSSQLWESSCLVSSFSLNKKCYSFWYNQENGSISISEHTPHNNVTVWSRSHHYRGASFSILLALTSEDGTPLILLYDVHSGLTKILAIRKSEGSNEEFSVTTRWSGSLGDSHQWTHFAGCTIRNTQFFLAYSSHTGKTRLYRLLPNAEGIRTSWRDHRTWDRDWSHLQFFRSSSQQLYLLLYKKSGGRVILAEVTEPENIESFSGNVLSDTRPRSTTGVKSQTIYTSGWSSYVTYRQNNKAYLACLDDAIGRLQVWDISGGTDWTLIGETSDSHAAAEFLPFSGRIHFMFYESVDPNSSQGDPSKLWFLRYNAGLGSLLSGRIHATL